MNDLVDVRDPPPKRRAHCTGGKERHLTEAAVMIAFALHLLNDGATTVELHPDGEHGKRHDIKGTLEARGFDLVMPQGSTNYGGRYKREHQTVTVTLRPGLGDVVSEVGGRTVIAECKGGVVNSRHAGQVSRLSRGLCEAVGRLMARPLCDERHVAVVPATEVTARLAERMAGRARAAGIELALVEETGNVVLAMSSQNQCG
jgi:hypothetical protein